MALEIILTLVGIFVTALIAILGWMGTALSASCHHQHNVHFRIFGNNLKRNHTNQSFFYT